MNKALCVPRKENLVFKERKDLYELDSNIQHTCVKIKSKKDKAVLIRAFYQPS